MSEQRDHAVGVLLGSVAVEANGGEPTFLGPRVAKRQAIELLSGREASSALELAALVRAATADADAHVRRAAVEALAAPVRAAVGVPVLIACCGDRDLQVRQIARRCLGRLQPELATGLPPEPKAPTEPVQYELSEVRADTAIPI